MSSKFNIELAQGTITVEGDQEFIMSVYQALQSTLLSGNDKTAAPTPAPAESTPDEAAPAAKATDSEPEPAEAEAAPDESEVNVTPIIKAAELTEEASDTPAENAAPIYEPIPSVLDPERAEREKAEAEAAAEPQATEEAAEESAYPDSSSVLEQIKDSLGDDVESGNQTSILQRIRDSLSEDADKTEEEAPRARDAG